MQPAMTSSRLSNITLDRALLYMFVHALCHFHGGGKGGGLIDRRRKVPPLSHSPPVMTFRSGAASFLSSLKGGTFWPPARRVLQPRPAGVAVAVAYLPLRRAQRDATCPVHGPLKSVER